MTQRSRAGLRGVVVRKVGGLSEALLFRELATARQFPNRDE